MSQQPPFPPGFPQPYPMPGAAVPPAVPGYPAAPFPAPGYPQAPYAAPQGFAPPAYGGAAPAPRAAHDPLKGFDEADPTGSRLPHFNADRRYLLECAKIEFIQGRNDDFVTMEFNVLESDDPMLAAGRAAKYMIKMGQDMSMPNLKSALGALLGYGTKEEIVANVTQDVARAALSEAQPNRGKRVSLTTTSTTTKQGKPFTVHNWSPASGHAPVTVQAAAPLPFHPQAAMMGQGYVPNMAPPPAAPSQPASFPPAGWYAHPQQPGAYHNGREIVSEAELRARQAQGRA